MGCTKPSLQQDFFKPRKVVTKILYGSCPANLTVTRRRKWQSTHLPAHARAVGKILKAHKSHTHTQTMTVALHRHPACTGVGLVPDFCQTFLCKTQFFGHLAVREPATRICSVTRLPVSLRRKTRLGLIIVGIICILPANRCIKQEQSVRFPMVTLIETTHYLPL